MCVKAENKMLTRRKNIDLLFKLDNFLQSIPYTFNFDKYKLDIGNTILVNTSCSFGIIAFIFDVAVYL